MNMKADHCPVTKVSHLLSDAWTILIIHQLLQRPHRFCELEAALAGISTRTLTQKLERLHKKHLIKKTAHGYSPAKAALPLKKIIKSMEEYGKKHL